LITLACLAGAPVSGAADLGVDREFPAPHEVLGAADRLGTALPDGLTRLLHPLATEHLDRPQ
jgi:hypothetical protein